MSSPRSFSSQNSTSKFNKTNQNPQKKETANKYVSTSKQTKQSKFSSSDFALKNLIDSALTNSAGIFAVTLAMIVQIVILILLVGIVINVDPLVEKIDFSHTFLDVGIAASSLWLMAHGASILTNDFEFSLCPLGLTLFFMLIIYICSKRANHMNRQAIILGSVAYSLLTFILTALVRFSNVNQDISAVRSAIYSLFFSFIAIFMANTNGSFFSRAASVLRNRSEKIIFQKFIITPLRSSIAAFSLLLLLSCLLTLFSIASNSSFSDGSFATLNVSPISSAVVSFSQLALVPNIIIWNLSYLFSVGFEIGPLATFSQINFVETKTLPPIPALSGILTIEPSFLLSVFSFLSIFIIGMICSAWNIHKNRDEFFVFNYDSKKMHFGFIAYSIVSVLVGVLTFAVGALSIASFSSGYYNFSDSTELSRIGINSFDFMTDLTEKFFLGSLLVLIPYTIYSLVKLNNAKYDIIRKAVKQNVEKTKTQNIATVQKIGREYVGKKTN